MSYWEQLVADVKRRFEKVVREQAVLDAVPVTELSDSELAHQVAKNAAAPITPPAEFVAPVAADEAPAPADNAA